MTEYPALAQSGPADTSGECLLFAPEPPWDYEFASPDIGVVVTVGFEHYWGAKFAAFETAFISATLAFR